MDSKPVCARFRAGRVQGRTSPVVTMMTAGCRSQSGCCGQLAGTLSGGEQRMVGFAEGLMTAPKLLLLDEPSLGLAPKIVEEAFAKVQQIGKSEVTVLIAEQNVVDGLSISDRGYLVENGEITLQGSPNELLGNEQIRAAYLGLYFGVISPLEPEMQNHYPFQVVYVEFC
jgi:ABC-type multidrug transport system ATPase subunit